MSSVTVRHRWGTAQTRTSIPLSLNDMSGARSLGASVIQNMHFTRKVYWT